MGKTPASSFICLAGVSTPLKRSGQGVTLQRPAAPGWEGPRTWVSHWPAAALGRQGGAQAGPLGCRPLWLGWAPDL